MSADPPHTPTDEPRIQGLPRHLIAALCGLAGLLILAGVVNVAMALWDHVDTWLRMAMLLPIPLAVLVAHILMARRSGQGVLTVPAVAMLLAHVVLLPLGVVFGAWLTPVFSLPCALAYALVLIWYGAYYQYYAVISAAVAVFFTSVLMGMELMQLGAILRAVLLLVLGGLVLAGAAGLHRRRRAKLALLHIALRRRELDRAGKEDDASEEAPHSH